MLWGACAIERLLTIHTSLAIRIDSIACVASSEQKGWSWDYWDGRIIEEAEVVVRRMKEDAQPPRPLF